MPRRKWALPWFQSEVSEWVNSTNRILASRRETVLAAELRPSLHPGLKLGVEGVERRSLAGLAGKALSEGPVFDQAIDRARQAVGVARREEQRRSVPQLAEARDVGEHERGAEPGRLEHRQSERLIKRR